MQGILLVRKDIEEGASAGSGLTLKPGRFYVYHDDGAVEEVGPATSLFFTPEKVYVLLGEWPAATYDRDDIFFITREEVPAPPIA